MAVNGTKKQKLENGSAGIPPMVTGGTVSWDRDGNPFFSMGEGTLQVPMAMHAAHRKKLCEVLRAKGLASDAVILLQGGEEISVYDTDTNWDFKQESNFQYLFGVKEPGCYAALRVGDAHGVLCIPRMDRIYEAWCGPVKPPAWFSKAYGIEAAHVDELQQVLEKLGRTQPIYLTLREEAASTVQSKRSVDQMAKARELLFQKIPTELQNKYRAGCSTCRHRPFCTLSCWAKRGYVP
eukprot:symbB.v1.2.002090.t1/scaffold109.1/size325261/8